MQRLFLNLMLAAGLTAASLHAALSFRLLDTAGNVHTSAEWSGQKAIVLFCDASAQIMKCTQGTNPVVNRPGGTTNLFSPGANWLDATANFVLIPQP